MKLLSLTDLKDKGISYSRAHIDRLVKASPPKFPAPIKLGENRNAWVEAEIDDWIAARVAERDAERKRRATPMPSNVVSLLAARKAREEPKKQTQIKAVVDPNVAIKKDDLIALCSPRGSVNVMFCRWLGSTGRDIRGRFVKKGKDNPYEVFQLDNGLQYYTRQVQCGTVDILGVVHRGHVSDETRPLTAA